MKYEYLLFDLIVLAGPLALSFDSKVRFWKHWKFVFPAIVLGSLPWLIWDVAVTERHWFFNPDYTLGTRFLGLPLEEWLFFLVVPYACLFVWECLVHYRPWSQALVFPYHPAIGLIFGGLSIPFFLWGWEYTSLSMLAMALVIGFHEVLNSPIFKTQAYYAYLFLLILTTLIFNMYLTGRPIVTYDTAFQLDFRIYSIPIEDFFFGISHLSFVLLVYTQLKDRFKTTV